MNDSQRIKRLQAQNSVLQAQQELAEDVELELRTQIKELKDQMTRQQATGGHIDGGNTVEDIARAEPEPSKVHDLETKVNELQKDLENAKSKIAKQDKDLDDAARKLDMLQAEVGEANEAYRFKKLEVESFKNIVKGHEETKKQANKRASAFEKQRDTVQRKLDRLISEVKAKETDAKRQKIIEQVDRETIKTEPKDDVLATPHSSCKNPPGKPSSPSAPDFKRSFRAMSMDEPDDDEEDLQDYKRYQRGPAAGDIGRRT